MTDGIGDDLAVGLGLWSHITLGTVVGEEVPSGCGSGEGGVSSLPRLFGELEVEGV